LAQPLGESNGFGATNSKAIVKIDVGLPFIPERARTMEGSLPHDAPFISCGASPVRQESFSLLCSDATGHNTSIASAVSGGFEGEQPLKWSDCIAAWLESAAACILHALIRARDREAISLVITPIARRKRETNPT
jgi:hypothetical protein